MEMVYIIKLENIIKDDIIYIINEKEILELKVDHIEDIKKLNSKGEMIIQKGIVGIIKDPTGLEFESYTNYEVHKEDIFKTYKEAEEKLIKVEENKR